MFQVFPISQPSRYLSGFEASRVWDEVYGDCPEALMRRRGCTIIAAWRLVRLLAYKQGRLQPSEPIWTLRGALDDPVAGPAAGRLTQSPDPRDWTLKELLSREGGVTLAPPAAREDRVRFCAALEAMADVADMERGSQQIPELPLGLHDLVHEDTVAKAWPGTEKLERFEQSLVDQTKRFIYYWSPAKCQQHLKELLNLTAQEAQGLIRMAAEDARAEAIVDEDTARALMLGAVQATEDDARDAADLNNLLKALKLRMGLLGLTKTSPDGEDEEFKRVIARVSTEPPAQITAETAVPQETEDE